MDENALIGDRIWMTALLSNNQRSRQRDRMTDVGRNWPFGVDCSHFVERQESTPKRPFMLVDANVSYPSTKLPSECREQSGS